MHTTVLMDLTRLRQITNLITFEVNEVGALEWSPRIDYCYKFLILPDDKMVIGPFADHRLLYALYATRDASIEDARVYVSANRQWKDDITVVGAGAIATGGRVVEWKSTGFSVRTPDWMRDAVQETIAMLFQDSLLHSR